MERLPASGNIFHLPVSLQLVENGLGKLRVFQNKNRQRRANCQKSCDFGVHGVGNYQ